MSSNVESFSIHLDIAPSSNRGSGEIREEIVEMIDHPDVVRLRTSVVKEGPFEHKLGD